MLCEWKTPKKTPEKNTWSQKHTCAGSFFNKSATLLKNVTNTAVKDTYFAVTCFQHLQAAASEYKKITLTVLSVWFGIRNYSKRYCIDELT